MKYKKALKVGKNLQLNITTDYGIRVLLALHQSNGLATADQISEMMGISHRYLVKIVRKLKKSGFINSIPGPTGGYQLVIPISEITVGQVFSSMEQTMKINHCIEEEGKCSRNAQICCPVRRFYSDLQNHLEHHWFSKSLQEIIDTY